MATVTGRLIENLGSKRSCIFGSVIVLFASGGKGLFLKKPPLDPAKIFYTRSNIVLCLLISCPIMVVVTRFLSVFVIFFIFASLRVLRGYSYLLNLL
jgi:hypothetical protein